MVHHNHRYITINKNVILEDIQIISEKPEIPTF